jgi:TonB family protein
MIRDCISFRPNGLRRAGVRFISAAAALALLLTLSIPSRAEERAVKMRVAPVYPEMAKRMRISGVVQLEVTVDASGKVIGAKPVSGNRMLSDAAQEAVAKWKFEPGAGVATMVVSINFAQ